MPDQEETSEQLSFGFYEAMQPGDIRGNRVFDSEDDALNAMLDRQPDAPPETTPEDAGEAFPGGNGTAEEDLSANGEGIESAGLEKTNSFPSLTETGLRRAVLGFLAAMKPDGLGIRFLSPVPRLRADAGAFFLAPGCRTPAVVRSVLVMFCLHREDYCLDKAEKTALKASLDAEREKKSALEEMLKEREPGLKDDSLFDETRTWDFSKTKNRRYHACLHRIEKLEYSISRGSKFDHLLCEQAANEFYLAVPSGLISLSEAPAGWGLLAVGDDFSVQTLLEAPRHECPPENQSAFALRTVSTNVKAFLFAHGIALAEDGAARFYPLPRRRRSYLG